MSEPAGKRRDLFLSHGSADKGVAEELCAGFETAGLTCWIAPRDIDPGSSWTGSIMAAIAECRVMVLIFSAKSNASQHVQREILHAMERGYPMLPIRVEEVLPTGGLAYCLLGLQWYDAFSPPLSQHFARLVGRVRELLGAPVEKGAATGSAQSSLGFDPKRDVYFHCEKCGQSLVTDIASVGQSGECPACRSPFTVPSPDAEAAKMKSTAATPSEPLQAIPPEEVQKIEACFTAVMGPIGPKIVQKAIAAGTTRVALRHELLEAIPAAADRESFLRCCGNLLPAGLGQARAPQKTATLKPVPPPARATFNLDAAGVDGLKTTLATFLGPLAKVLVDRALPKAADENDLIQRLAEELDAAEDRERFAQAARKILQNRATK